MHIHNSFSSACPRSWASRLCASVCLFAKISSHNSSYLPSILARLSDLDCCGAISEPDDAFVVVVPPGTLVLSMILFSVSAAGIEETAEETPETAAYATATDGFPPHGCCHLLSGGLWRQQYRYRLSYIAFTFALGTVIQNVITARGSLMFCFHLCKLLPQPLNLCLLPLLLLLDCPGIFLLRFCWAKLLRLCHLPAPLLMRMLMHMMVYV